MSALLKTDETLDDLLIGDLRLIQKKKGFRFTLDAVLLAHFATVKAEDKVVDLGCGTGIIPLLLQTRHPELQISGLEIQAEIAEMAQRSVQLNGLEETIQIIEGDFRKTEEFLPSGVFNLVTANPPYWEVGSGRVSKCMGQALARHEIACTLEDIVGAARRLLNYQGRLALIYPVDNLVELFLLLRTSNLEPRRLRLLHSFPEDKARLALVEARRGAPVKLQIEAPLFVYEKSGQYSAEISAWYGKEGLGSEA